MFSLMYNQHLKCTVAQGKGEREGGGRGRGETWEQNAGLEVQLLPDTLCRQVFKF